MADDKENEITYDDKPDPLVNVVRTILYDNKVFRPLHKILWFSAILAIIVLNAISFWYTVANLVNDGSDTPRICDAGSSPLAAGEITTLAVMTGLGFFLSLLHLAFIYIDQDDYCGVVQRCCPNDFFGKVGLLCLPTRLVRQSVRFVFWISSKIIYFVVGILLRQKKYALRLTAEPLNPFKGTEKSAGLKEDSASRLAVSHVALGVVTLVFNRQFKDALVSILASKKCKLQGDLLNNTRNIKAMLEGAVFLFDEPWVGALSILLIVLSLNIIGLSLAKKEEVAGLVIADLPVKVGENRLQNRGDYGSGLRGQV